MRYTALRGQFFLLVLSCCLSACLSQRLFDAPERLFSPLAKGKLSDYEQGIAHLKLRGASGDAMELAIQWLYTALCVPYTQSPKYQSPLWDALSIGLRLEVLRAHSPLLNDLQAQSELTSREVRLEEWAVWPLSETEQEGWPDELPMWLNLESKCQVQGQASSVNITSRDRTTQVASPLISQLTHLLWPLHRLFGVWRVDITPLEEWYQHLLADRALHALISWGEQEQSPPLSLQLREWRWWLKREKALRLSRLSTVPLGWSPRSKELSLIASFLYTESCSMWGELSRESEALQAEDTRWRNEEELLKSSAQTYLMNGLCYRWFGDEEEAFKEWERAIILSRDELAPVTFALTRYHQLRALIELGRYQEAIELRSALPSPDSPLFSSFAFALGEAMDYAGRGDALMALSTEVFRDQSWRKDPFLRGLFYLFIRGLTRYSFEERVIELLEDLGPRRSLYERVFLFAHVALDEGEEESGRSATTWLLGHHESAVWRPRYHALSARAAILRLDRATFINELRLISPSSGPVLEAIHQGRRGAFFEQQDRALVELLRVEVPRIAGWAGETKVAARRRVVWLDLIAEEMQRFLRLRPETRSRRELIALYRSIRQNLPASSLRAYSEKVGRDESLSVLIGHVKVSGVELSHLEPRSITPNFSLAPSLTLAPRSHLDPSKWSLSWSHDEMTH